MKLNRYSGLVTPAAWTVEDWKMEDDALLLAILGVRVIEAPRLPEPVLLIRRHGIALVDADLSREDRHAVLDRLVSHVARLGH